MSLLVVASVYPLLRRPTKRQGIGGIAATTQTRALLLLVGHIFDTGGERGDSQHEHG
jgi:hypothetical protein